jgi:hypothetical protein
VFGSAQLRLQHGCSTFDTYSHMLPGMGSEAATRDGGCALPGCIDSHAHRIIERSRVRIADARSIGSRSFRYT